MVFGPLNHQVVFINRLAGTEMPGGSGRGQQNVNDSFHAQPIRSTKLSVQNIERGCDMHTGT